MEYELRDFFIILLFISVVIGYQIFIYFLYQYYKAKKEKLDLSKILLAYGTIFGLTLTGFFIRNINLYYIGKNNLEIFDFLTKLTFLLLYSALMLFFIIISSDTFHEIINSNLTKILAITITIPLITVFLLQIESFLFILITGITLVISYSYILYFHIRLTRLSTGSIKKRLNFILIGFALCVIQHFIGGYIPSYILFQKYFQILQVISAPIFLCGLIIVFLGVFRFPAFLEFGWRESLLYIFIIDQRNCNVIYSFDFKEVISKNKNKIKKFPMIKESKLIFSSGIIGINDIISGITNTNYEYVETIKQEDFLILLNHGDTPLSYIIYCLIVSKDMKSYRYFLKIIKNEFEHIYKNILINLNELKGIEKELFLGFDVNIKKLIE